MTSLMHKTNGTSFASFDYGYNAVGNRTNRTESSAGFQPATDTYSYDSTDQIASVNYNTGARTVSYQWDAVGNRTTVTDNGVGINYTANSLNQYTAIGGGSPTYDTKGNLVTQNGWTYTFDAQNRLLTATNNTTTSSFSYDAMNRCVSRTINGTTTLLIYDAWNLIEEWTTGGAQVAHYVHGPRMDELLVKVSTTNAVYYHHDGLGSVTHLTGTNGIVVEKYTYDIFGKPTILDASSQLLSATAYGNRFLFTGREWLAEISLYDYRNRCYSPDLGRFLQTDPIRFDAGDANLYRYVANDPLDNIDPKGESLMNWMLAWVTAIWMQQAFNPPPYQPGPPPNAPFPGYKVKPPQGTPPNIPPTPTPNPNPGPPPPPPPFIGPNQPPIIRPPTFPPPTPFDPTMYGFAFTAGYTGGSLIGTYVPAPSTYVIVTPVIPIPIPVGTNLNPDNLTINQYMQSGWQIVFNNWGLYTH